MACAPGCYEVVLQSCSDTIIVSAGLTPNTEYYWVIENRHGNLYQRLVTTDANGLLAIDTSVLPLGSLNKHAGFLKLKIKDGSNYANVVTLQFGEESYSCVLINLSEIDRENDDMSALNVIQAAGSSSPENPRSGYLIPFTSSNFTGTNSLNIPAIVGRDLAIYVNDINRYLFESEWEPTGTGINILLPGFDATTNQYSGYIFIL
jgi:hypothetical protein